MHRTDRSFLLCYVDHHDKAYAWAERRKSSDVGQPEGLAYKIEVFEAVARRDGWMVGTPRIPGIAYRDLDDID